MNVVTARISIVRLGWIAQLFVVGIVSAQAPNRLPPPPQLPPPPGVAPTAASMDLLQEHLLYGIDGDWSGRVAGRDYQLSSRAAEGGIQYFWVQTKPETEGRRSLSVNVDVLRGGSAGLIYGFQENPKSYFLILLDAERTLHVYERSPDGFQEILSSTTQGSSPARLELVENGQEISVRVDGNNLLSLGNDRVGRGGFGIAAMNAGDYRFGDFKFAVN